MAKIKSIIEYIKDNKNKQVDVKSLILDHGNFFLMIPLFAFLIAPIYYLIVDVPTNIDYHFNGFYTYSYTINYVIYLSVAAGPVAILIHFLSRKKSGIKEHFTDYIPMAFFAVFCVLMVVSTCINGFTIEALQGDGYRNESLFSFLVYFISMYFCGSLISDGKIKRFLIGLFFASVLVVDAIELFNYYIKPIKFFEYSDADAPSSIFYQFNHYGYFLMLAIMMSAGIFAMSRSVKYKIFAGFMLILNTFMLVLNTTFGCFLACLIGMFFLLIVSSVVNRKFSWYGLAAFGIFLLVTFVAGLKYYSFFDELGHFFTDIRSVLGSVNETVISVNDDEITTGAADSAGTGRWGLWRNTFNYIKEKPLFGWGVEGIGDMLMEDSGYISDRPHDEYLQYAAFFGVPALVMYIGGIAAHFIRALKNRKSYTPESAACLVAAFAYLISAVFGNTMFYTAPYFFIFLGLASEAGKTEKIRENR